MGRLLILFFLLAPAQIMITSLLLPLTERDLPELNEFARLAREKKDVLFFGDSTAQTIGKKDDDRRYTVDMLSADIAPLSIQGITHPGYQAEVYLEFIKRLNGFATPPKIIIVTVNMRSFSPSWDMNPHWQFDELKILLRATGWKFYFYRWLKVLQFDFSTVSSQQMESSGVFDGAVRMGAFRDFMMREGRKKQVKKINTRNTLLTAYMGYIRADQRQLVALKSIARLLPRSGITPIFYITPVDYQIGESFFPKRFRERLERNSAVIRGELAAQGATVLDLTTALGTRAFAWRQVLYPNEHLNQEGRSFVARQLYLRIMAEMRSRGASGLKTITLR